MEKIRIGVIGLGEAATKIHIPRLRLTPEMALIAVADLSEEKVNRTRSMIRGIKGYTNYVRLCERKDVDAIFVLTPPASHCEICTVAAENGKYIFCEKPIATSVKEAKKMIERVRKTHTLLMIGSVMRFAQNMVLFKKFLKFIGSDLEAKTIYRSYLPNTGDTFRYDYKRGGGALFETGTHHINLLRWFFGEGTPVSVDMKIEMGVDILTIFSLQFENGTQTHTEISWRSKVAQNAIEVRGSNGYVKTDFTTAPKLTVNCSLSNIFRKAGDLTVVLTGGKDAYFREIDHFVSCIRNEQYPLTSGEEALRDLQLVLDIYSKGDISLE